MYNNPDTKDKVLCAILYTGMFFPLVTFAPIIWIIVANLRKIYLKEFVKYHCFQAVLFNMIIFFLPGLFNVLFSFGIDIVKLILEILKTTNFVELLNMDSSSPIVMLTKFKQMVINIYDVFAHILAIYATIWTARGKYTYIPPISQAVNQILR